MAWKCSGLDSRSDAGTARAQVAVIQPSRRVFEADEDNQRSNPIEFSPGAM